MKFKSEDRSEAFVRFKGDAASIKKAMEVDSNFTATLRT
jgi:hypothetical protein